MKLRALILLLVLATAATAAQAAGNGHLVLVGGGDKPLAAMQKFIELAGGPGAPIIVIPTASTEPDTGQYYRDYFGKELGCTNVEVLEIWKKADAGRSDYVDLAKRARGIFFGGGDQIRILNALEGTPVLDAIRASHEQGAVVGGTSAGTACQSRIMLTGEGDFNLIQSRAVETWNGLGFLDDGIVVDQHFVARRRSNRLISVVLEHPDRLGVGIDEDTAVWFRPDGRFTVIGANSVMIFDARHAALRRRALDTGRELLGASGMRVDILLDGDSYDFKTGRVTQVKGTSR
ncbi:MAG: cyanophycinase [Thermoanaerobaculia bacterium]|jgi:cyanophycinase